MIFSIFRFFCILRFSNSCISAKYCATLINHTSYLFSCQMMYKSQFEKIDPHDWFCGPGSHMKTPANPRMLRMSRPTDGRGIMGIMGILIASIVFIFAFAKWLNITVNVYLYFYSNIIQVIIYTTTQKFEVSIYMFFCKTLIFLLSKDVLNW